MWGQKDAEISGEVSGTLGIASGSTDSCRENVRLDQISENSGWYEKTVTRRKKNVKRILQIISTLFLFFFGKGYSSVVFGGISLFELSLFIY